MEQPQLLLFHDNTYNEVSCSWTQVIKTHHLIKNRSRSYDEISDRMAQKSQATGKKNKLNSGIK